jgi:hypothetical protein
MFSPLFFFDEVIRFVLKFSKQNSDGVLNSSNIFIGPAILKLFVISLRFSWNTFTLHGQRPPLLSLQLHPLHHIQPLVKSVVNTAPLNKLGLQMHSSASVFM